MALPIILSLLGSTAAGAGMLGAMSPLIAGALGSGIGTAIQEKDLGKGLMAGLTSGMLGGMAGKFLGSAAGGAGGAAGGAAAQAGVDAATQTGMQAAAAQAGVDAATQTGMQAAAPGGIGELFQNLNIQPGNVAGPAMPAGTPLSQKLMQGIGGRGAMSAAGMGTALGAGMMMTPEGLPGTDYGPGADQADPANRERRTPGPGYRPGYDAEALYYDPAVPVSRFSGGGSVEYRPPGMDVAYRMAAGGLADMMPQAAPSAGASDKDLVQNAIRAVRGQLPERDAAMVLGQFMQVFGEDALRKLVSDVESGRADGARGDVEGRVRGPGDGMSDMVPAEMDDGSQDVLLSDGEFVVPADVVSGLGNGSTDAGAQELEEMMGRVRAARTGRTEQPQAMAAGGALPA